MFEAIFRKLFGGKSETVEPEVVARSLPKVEPTTPMPAVKKPAPAVKTAVKKRQPQISRKRALARKQNTNARDYYRRGGKYYNVADDSIIDDLMLLYVLTELFADNEIQTFEEMRADTVEPVQEDLQDIDVSDTPVVDSQTWKVETPVEPEPTYPTAEPEPETTRYDAGSSYSSGSSDYDSGGSDYGSDD